VKPAAFLLAGIGALVVTLFSGTIHGRFTNRWGTPPDLEAAGRRMESLPTTFGDWRLLTKEDLDDNTVRLLQCTGYINHIYQNKKNPSLPQVQVAVLVGPAGPISVHTPEICYSSRDYTVEQARRHLSIHLSGESGEQELWGMSMRPKNPAKGTLRVCYGWSTGGAWQAPEHPRFQYGGQPLLYKIQIASEVAPGSSSDESELCTSFLREFLPVLDQRLFASASQTE